MCCPAEAVLWQGELLDSGRDRILHQSWLGWLIAVV